MPVSAEIGSAHARSGRLCTCAACLPAGFARLLPAEQPFLHTVGVNTSCTCQLLLQARAVVQGRRAGSVHMLCGGGVDTAQVCGSRVHVRARACVCVVVMVYFSWGGGREGRR